MIRALLAAASLSSAVAVACSCAARKPVLLRDGIVDVPTNVVLWGQYPSLAAAKRVVLVRQVDHSVISLRVDASRVPGIFTFTPEAKLEPKTAYEVSLPSVSKQSFTTGAGEDHVAPMPATFDGSSHTRRDSGSCGDQHKWALDVNGGSDDLTSRDDLLLLVSTADDSHGGIVTLGSTALRTGMCATNFTRPGGPWFRLDVQVIDLAGNVAPRSSGRGVSSCAAAPGAIFTLLALLLFRLKLRPVA